MEAIYSALGYGAARARVVVLGIDGAGKTSALERVKDAYTDVKGLRPEQIIPTIGMNIAKVDGDVACTFWDLGGVIGLRGIWEKYFEECDACAYVVDATNEERLEEAMVELERALNNPAFPKNIPLVVLANKYDLSGPEGLEMVRASCADVVAGARARPLFRVFPTDCRSGLGIKPAIDWLTRELARSSPSSRAFAL